MVFWKGCGENRDLHACPTRRSADRLGRLVEASDFSGVRVMATDGVEPIAFDDGHDDHGEDKHDDHDDHDDHDHADEEGHDHGDEHNHEITSVSVYHFTYFMCLCVVLIESGAVASAGAGHRNDMSMQG